MFGKRSIFLGVHPILVDEVDYHDLPSFDGLPYLLPVFFFLLTTEGVELLHLFFRHSLSDFIEFIFFGLAALVVSLFFHLKVIEVSFNFLDLFLMPLSLGLIILSLLFPIPNELLHPLFEDVKQRVLLLLFSRRLVQHYNSNILLHPGSTLWLHRLEFHPFGGFLIKCDPNIDD